MGGQRTSQPSIREPLPLAPSATGLLALFSRTSFVKDVVTGSAGRDTARLWRTDAIHRAKNLAQMAVSLADIADHPSRQWLRPEIAAQIRCLARAYDALAEDEGVSQQVPCAVLLSEIASRLIAIFGAPRGVSVELDVPSISIIPAVRRVLILLCSELIINALKYAYPSNAGGVIRVRLRAYGSQVQMVVEDDGVGVDDSASAGQGTGLIERLCAIVGADLVRGPGANGRGLRVEVTVPASTPTGA